MFCSLFGIPVDVETEWNLKDGVGLRCTLENTVDVETEWNLK